MNLKEKANELGFISKIKLVHENLKSPDMGELDKMLYYLWLCELQKWLRDIHGIYVESYHDYDPKDKGFQFYTNWGFHNPDTIEKKQSGWYDEYNNWKKYKDALEFGLQKGLKLIK